MNLLEHLITWAKSYDAGTLPNFPDPAPPADLGAAITQDDIDFVKSLRKEMTERFGTATCSDEKTLGTISNTAATSFTASWADPVGSTGTGVTYRVTGDPSWLVPNAIGNAAGGYSGTNFTFTSGFTVGVSYDIRVQNSCPSGYQSPGIILTATAT